MKSKLTLAIAASLLLVGCSSLRIGHRVHSYKESLEGTFSQELADQLGSGYTVTLTEGDNEHVNLKGKGFVVGSVGESKSKRWVLESNIAFMQYEDLVYGFSYTGPTSGTMRTSFEVTGMMVDLTGGFRIWVFRPYIGLRQLSYSMTTFGFTAGGGLGSTEIAVLNYEGLGGLSIDLPIGKKESFLSISADYGAGLKKGDGVKSSESLSGTAALNLYF